jgi:hypothetical protein
LKDVHEYDKNFIETLIEYTKSFKSKGMEKFANFEVKLDEEFYILIAFPQDEKNTIELEELELIKKAGPEQGHLSISRVSVVFQDSKACLRVLIVRNSATRAIQVSLADEEKKYVQGHVQYLRHRGTTTFIIVLQFSSYLSLDCNPVHMRSIAQHVYPPTHTQ